MAIVSSPGRIPPGPRSLISYAAALACLAVPLSLRAEEPAGENAATEQRRDAIETFVERRCVECHGSIETKGDLDLEALLEQPIAANADRWEAVVRRVTARQMPPKGMPRPSLKEADVVLGELTSALDEQAEAVPKPGRTATLRRLTRTEYQNAIRDLLALDIDAAALLPPDESGHGFDNVTATELSPTRMERYVDAAQKISRLAVGRALPVPDGQTIRVRPDLTQEEQVEGLPIGTRGGLLVPHVFPQAGTYEVEVRLTRDRDEHVEGLDHAHELEILLDRERVGSFTIHPPKNETEHATIDRHLKMRLSVSAGPHDLGVTFPKEPSRLLETKRQPYQARFNLHRHPRTSPAIYELSIVGPFDAQGPGDTPSRRQIFVRLPEAEADEEACAEEILWRLMRQAYRRTVGEVDLERPMDLYRQARSNGDFEAGVEAGLAAILVNPNFLFRIELDPENAATGEIYPVGDLELASRLSFFLWSSLPDEELLSLAERGELSDSATLEAQVRRMLADPRSESLATNFAAQWLHLRNLASASPDARLFPDFDHNLRESFRRESESLFACMVEEDKSVLYLLDPREAFLDERLAKHYGVPHVYGSRLRRVPIEDGSRGGLLEQGSVLTVTSYATRTSPTIRGKWILENLIGTPPPPPPADVPALEDVTVDASLSVRERLAQHRANVACASCHDLIDPVGLALENFDAVGRWRTLEAGLPIDASGGLADGTEFEGAEGLEKALLANPEPFVTTLTEKLMTFALGRGIGPADAPAVRKIVRDAKNEDYRFSALVVGIARSVPFRLREAE